MDPVFSNRNASVCCPVASLTYGPGMTANSDNRQGITAAICVGAAVPHPAATHVAQTARRIRSERLGTRVVMTRALPAQAAARTRQRTALAPGLNETRPIRASPPARPSLVFSPYVTRGFTGGQVSLRCLRQLPGLR